MRNEDDAGGRVSIVRMTVTCAVTVTRVQILAVKSHTVVEHFSSILVY